MKRDPDTIGEHAAAGMISVPTRLVRSNRRAHFGKRGARVGVSVRVGVGRARPLRSLQIFKLISRHAASGKRSMIFVCSHARAPPNRLSFAAKLVLAAVEGRHAESAVAMAFMRVEGGFGNPLAHPFYR